MSYLITAVAFIVIFSLLIIIHEFGHYITAKRAGIKVEEFGLGLPPKMVRLFKRGDTSYTLNWIPFGGFVRLYGEDDFSKKAMKDPKSFQSKSVWNRTMVIVAGVLMNFVLAVVLLWGGFTIGMKPLLLLLTSREVMNEAIAEGVLTLESQMLVVDVDSDSPAFVAGFRAEDIVLRVNGVEVRTHEDLLQQQTANIETLYEVERDGKELNLNVVPDGEGHIGVQLAVREKIADVKVIKLPIHEALYKSVTESVRIMKLTFYMLGDVVSSVFSKFAVPDGVAGPVGILQMTHDISQMGFMMLIQLCAVLSLSLAVINIMPFPALDGGRLLFIVFEVVTRKRVSQKIEGYVHAVGFLLLLFLIIIVTWNDIVRLLCRTWGVACS